MTVEDHSRLREKWLISHFLFINSVGVRILLDITVEQYDWLRKIELKFQYLLWIIFPGRIQEGEPLSHLIKLISYCVA